MIKLENTVTPSPEQWRAIISGMRNAKNSWDRSDSERKYESWHDMSGGTFEIGPNDHGLMTKLAKGGSVHAKYRRMITVYVDITAPLYWWAEFDTYKVGTVRNSCSFMHKGVSRPFCINDFSLKNEKIYEVLNDLETKEYKMTYPYETNEYRRYVAANGRGYRVYRNGRVVREAFDYIDNYGSGRKRHFEEADATVYQNKSGYFVIKMSGRGNSHISLHRLVAEVWLNRPYEKNQVNHIDGNKGNNSVENLEWVTASENMQKSVDSGLHDNLHSLHRIYKVWKNNSKVIPAEKRMIFKRDVVNGLSIKELAEKYNILPVQANNAKYVVIHSEHEDLFQECLIWGDLIGYLNSLRDLYIETKDDKIFQQIRCLMPQGYLQKSTIMLNYEVLVGMYRDRKNHKLDEWRELCSWIKSLPYSEIITGEE